MPPLLTQTHEVWVSLRPIGRYGIFKEQCAYFTLYSMFTHAKLPMQAHKIVPTKAIWAQKYCFFLNYANIFAKICKNITKVAQKVFASQVCE